jgi:hypothetical protein
MGGPGPLLHGAMSCHLGPVNGEVARSPVYSVPSVELKGTLAGARGSAGQALILDEWWRMGWERFGGAWSEGLVSNGVKVAFSSVKSICGVDCLIRLIHRLVKGIQLELH